MNGITTSLTKNKTENKQRLNKRFTCESLHTATTKHIPQIIETWRAYKHIHTYVTGVIANTRSGVSNLYMFCVRILRRERSQEGYKNACFSIRTYENRIEIQHLTLQYGKLAEIGYCKSIKKKHTQGPLHCALEPHTQSLQTYQNVRVCTQTSQRDRYYRSYKNKSYFSSC